MASALGVAPTKVKVTDVSLSDRYRRQMQQGDQEPSVDVEFAVLLQNSRCRCGFRDGAACGFRGVSVSFAVSLWISQCCCGFRGRRW